MMNDPERQFLEDRALRDAAQALLRADIARLKGDFSGRGLGARALDRAKDGASEMLEQAGTIADTNRGILGVLVMAIVLWFARNPILALFSDEEDWAQSDTDAERSPEHPVGKHNGDDT